MSVQLSAASEQCLQRLHLQEPDQNTMREIISRYSPPQTFCQGLSWIVYRICNAIASLFGASDWQKAQKMIQENAMRLANEANVFPAEPLAQNDERFRRVSADYLNNVSSTIGNVLLDHCLDFNSVDIALQPAQTLLPSADLRDLINGDVRDFVHQLQERALNQ